MAVVIMVGPIFAAELVAGNDAQLDGQFPGDNFNLSGVSRNVPALQATSSAGADEIAGDVFLLSSHIRHRPRRCLNEAGVLRSRQGSVHTSR